MIIYRDHPYCVKPETVKNYKQNENVFNNGVADVWNRLPQSIAGSEYIYSFKCEINKHLFNLQKI